MRKRILSLVLMLTMASSLAGCTGVNASGNPIPAVSVSGTSNEPDTAEKPIELIVFAAASMTETLNQIVQMYKVVDPNVTFSINYDSSGTLKTQIEEGADCDIFISASSKQMNALDIAADKDENPLGLDFILAGTRFDLVSNSVVLISPQGNPRGVSSFEDVATERVSMIALGNSDVPVGQYSREIFTYIGIWEQLMSAQKVTFGTNVKEVLAQVSEGAVDCGVVYSTDAATSSGIEVIASAPPGSHKDITYPAAVLNDSGDVEAAQAFLNYLTTDECSAIFESVGFVIPD
ncbi:molybdate ABC transporter substrate-binding protein [Youngiibacter fragilis]|uniref:Molybdate ABC transporter substrate-binding protein n=1 Tax=Youngiibacter fragilis 232.1 TaxID=994573 RepID=V7I2Q5_9CLOT|nr:molybdate ABC transporter substrate-binding protein [Youngiibacter fragilis]ETA80525.1 molybdate ABC transporter substrate-binding protein [Youngiibacter fragilis 232.1]